MALSGALVLAQQPQPSQPQAVFRSTTRLIVQTVTVKDKEGKPIEGLTAKDFTITEDGMPQDIAFVEYQRLQSTPVEVVDSAAQAQAPEPITTRPAQTPAAPAPAIQTQITTPPQGGIKYQDKRLIVMYFDGSSMGGADGLRAYVNARKYIDTQMSPSDLIAIMAFQNGAVSVKTDFTADKARLREVIDILIYGDDQNNDGIPDHPEGTAFGQTDAEFNIFNTDRQLAALQTAVTMLKPLPEQKTLLYFTSGLRLNGTDNMAQLRATENAAIRSTRSMRVVSWRRRRWATPRARRPAASGCSPARWPARR
jgi:VWFA-related protein